MDVYLTEYEDCLRDITEALEDTALSDKERAVLLACAAELRRGLEDMCEINQQPV